MQLTRKSITLLFIANNLLAFLCVFLIMPGDFFDDADMFWQLPLAIIILSVIFFALSAIVEAGVNKKNKVNSIHFWGQTPVTLIVLGFFVAALIRKIDREEETNAEYNRSFVSHGLNRGDSKSLRYRALMQLENAYDDKDDLRLQFYNFYKEDSAAVIYFIYSHKDHPGAALHSKHLIGERSEMMPYYNLSFREAYAKDSAFKRSWDGYKAMVATKEAAQKGEGPNPLDKQLQHFEGREQEMRLE